VKFAGANPLETSGFPLEPPATFSKPAQNPAGTVRRVMQDLSMLLFTVVFFVVAFLYVKACQKLR